MLGFSVTETGRGPIIYFDHEIWVLKSLFIDICLFFFNS